MVDRRIGAIGLAAVLLMALLHQLSIEAPPAVTHVVASRARDQARSAPPPYSDSMHSSAAARANPATPSVNSVEAAATSPSPPAAPTCPPGCTRHGNCDELTGRCECPFTHGGPACDEPLMPACELADGEPINLSILVSELAWQALRDVANDGRDERRLHPPYFWLGPLPCACVLQAVAAFSSRASPMPASWPRFIEHPFLSMQRVVCVDTGAASVAKLWSEGIQPHDAWAYVPVFAFLKMFPAHSPQLLPPGAVAEGTYRSPPGRFAVDLNRTALLPRGGRDGGFRERGPRNPYGDMPEVARPVRVPLAKMFASVGARSSHIARRPRAKGQPPTLLPLARCVRNARTPACGGVGWCDGGEPSARQPPVCRCAANLDQGAKQPSAATCSAAHQPDRPGDPRSRMTRRGGGDGNRLGPDFWRNSAGFGGACPNACRSRARSCAYGFCHCQHGEWGLDCGFSHERVASLAAHRAATRPRVHVYPLPPALRRSCNFWHLAEDVGDRLLRSDHLEPSAAHADLFWVYGCPNGDILLPALHWIQQHAPQWNESVARGAPRHVVVVPHEEGWAEVWRYLVHWLRGETGDHANELGTWDTLHPASPSRQIVSLQLSGRSDYPGEGQPKPIRCVSSRAPCYVCFQPGKDVMIPGHPGLIDYPREDDCARFDSLRAFTRAGTPAPRTLVPKVLFGGAIWTIPQGPGFYEPSRLILYLCHKNASRDVIAITQTETQPESVHAWEVEPRRDMISTARQASYCVVPEGKIGGYGHRATAALMLGCVPIISKERFSSDLFDDVVNWSSIALHVPPDHMPRLPHILQAVDPEPLRRAAASVRRRLLWTSIFGDCRLAEGEGGKDDAFTTLMAVLRVPRRHFRVSARHSAARAPELHGKLGAWLRSLEGGERCAANGRLTGA